MTEKLDFTKIIKTVFTDVNGVELVVNIDSSEKIDTIINVFHLLGHAGEENCSGADVGIEFRYVPNECREKGRVCCGL